MIFRCAAIIKYVGTQMVCVHCGSHAVQAAHRNQGKGMGIKVSDALIAALCVPEHTRIDQGKDLLRDERRALMDGYIVDTFLAAKKTAKLPVKTLLVWESELVAAGLLPQLLYA